MEKFFARIQGRRLGRGTGWPSRRRSGRRLPVPGASGSLENLPALFRSRRFLSFNRRFHSSFSRGFRLNEVWRRGLRAIVLRGDRAQPRCHASALGRGCRGLRSTAGKDEAARGALGAAAPAWLPSMRWRLAGLCVSGARTADGVRPSSSRLPIFMRGKCSFVQPRTPAKDEGMAAIRKVPARRRPPVARVQPPWT